MSMNNIKAAAATVAETVSELRYYVAGAGFIGLVAVVGSLVVR